MMRATLRCRGRGHGLRARKCSTLPRTNDDRVQLLRLLPLLYVARGEHLRPAASEGAWLASVRPFLTAEKGFFVMNAIDAEHDLHRLREAIDRVDEVIVRLLNQRAKYAIEIGELKGILGLPVYAPEREKDVLLHVERTSEGPLDPATVRRLFERIIDESRRVEREASHM